MKKSEGHGVKEAGSVRDERHHCAEQRCPTELLLKLPSPTQQSLATLGNGALEMCQGDRGTEFSLYLTLVYLNLNKHKQLEATILSGADIEQQVLNFVQ